MYISMYIFYVSLHYQKSDVVLFQYKTMIYIMQYNIIYIVTERKCRCEVVESGIDKVNQNES